MCARDVAGAAELAARIRVVGLDRKVPGTLPLAVEARQSADGVFDRQLARQQAGAGEVLAYRARRWRRLRRDAAEAHRLMFDQHTDEQRRLGFRLRLVLDAVLYAAVVGRLVH